MGEQQHMANMCVFRIAVVAMVAMTLGASYEGIPLDGEEPPKDDPGDVDFDGCPKNLDFYSDFHKRDPWHHKHSEATSLDGKHVEGVTYDIVPIAGETCVDVKGLKFIQPSAKNNQHTCLSGCWNWQPGKDGLAGDCQNYFAEEIRFSGCKPGETMCAGNVISCYMVQGKCLDKHRGLPACPVDSQQPPRDQIAFDAKRRKWHDEELARQHDKLRASLDEAVRPLEEGPNGMPELGRRRRIGPSKKSAPPVPTNRETVEDDGTYWVVKEDDPSPDEPSESASPKATKKAKRAARKAEKKAKRAARKAARQDGKPRKELADATTTSPYASASSTPPPTPFPMNVGGAAASPAKVSESALLEHEEDEEEYEEEDSTVHDQFGEDNFEESELIQSDELLSTN